MIANTVFSRRISWENLELFTDQLAGKIIESGVKFDMLIALVRGGLIPVRLLSDKINVKKIASIGIAYEHNDRERFSLYSSPVFVGNDLNILIVEDRIESGRSLKLATDYFRKNSAIIRTASYYVQTDSIIIPDYYLSTTNENIIFPWE